MKLWLRAIAIEAGRAPVPALLGVSLAGWVLYSLVAHAAGSPLPLCGGARGGIGLRGAEFSLAHWALMMLAMMPLLVAQPIRVLLRGSLRRKRLLALAAFVAGYALVWLGAGVVLLAGAAVARVEFAAAGRKLLLFPLVVGLACLWQVSPQKRSCLGRCHRVPTLRVFGGAAATDAFRYGLTSGCWCCGTCWALMLVPLAAETGHASLMAAVTLVAVAERYVPRAAPAGEGRGLSFIRPRSDFFSPTGPTRPAGWSIPRR